MKKYLLLGFLLACVFVYGQNTQSKPRKYPSLLWEITGKGLTKPSYLFGTMHVSSKLAFHLSDSFYLGIRKADVVALETNPETWQKELRKYDHLEDAYRDMYSDGRYELLPQDYLHMRTLQVNRYESLIERALSSRPVIINNLLYRSHSDEASDFEEDTYLDLHIFQTGKRWGKRVCSVENFDESMRLTTEAYVDGMKDDKRKTQYEYNPDYSYDKLETAYRTGNLDLLDTINQINQQSAAFTEKFLYKRNEIQAASIDSILKTKATLFVGVGAAHLPGQRGVIELLRNMGYQLRPVKMGERNSHFKEEVDKVKVAVQVKKQVADDGFFQVDMPGELFANNSQLAIRQFQYADMANGSYYMISRIPTNAFLWSASIADVTRQVDSLLYENIPGKILTKKDIVRNGYPGFDIVNKTRRGDLQRNAIFITPFEVLIFKVSGTGEYVKSALEVNRFFNSIELKDYSTSWRPFMPAYGGFEATMPHDPYIDNINDSWYFSAADKKSGNSFQIQRTDIHNYDFAEEDGFDLNLMEESFSSSEFIDETVSRKFSTQYGYPALDVQYRHKDGSVSLVKYLIKGPHYYTIIAHGKKIDEQMKQFLSSFSIKPFLYKECKVQTDTSLHFKVSVPFSIAEEKTPTPSFDVRQLYRTAYRSADEALVDNGQFKEKVIQNDSTGERVYVAFYNAPFYYYEADSVKLKSADLTAMQEGWIVRSEKKYELPNAMKVREYVFTDTNSSRALWCKQFLKQGLWYMVAAETDTAAQQSLFLTQFFQTFRPSDTIQTIDPFVKKSSQFFDDYFSADSIRHKKALMNVSAMTFDANDLDQLKKAMGMLGWKEKNYLNTKKEFIGQLGLLTGKAVSDYLKQLYMAAGDTLELQHAILESLLTQQTVYSYSTFTNIILNEPPVLKIETSDYDDYNPSYYIKNTRRNKITVSGYPDKVDGAFLKNLSDSLQLTAGIFKDLLPLININDYEKPMTQLMQLLIDSNYLKAEEYDIYFVKFMMEAKQVWKKQSIGEKSKSIEAAQLQEDGDNGDKAADFNNKGNDQLNLYATLLIPFWDKYASVPAFMQQLLSSNDLQLKYNTMLLLLRHHRQVPDTLVHYFASRDDYRYELYNDLHKVDMYSLFPKTFESVEQLAKAKLMASNKYQRVDTLQLLDKIYVEHFGEKGYIYMYEYKNQKDDANWKIATVGLVPAAGNYVEIVPVIGSKYTDEDFDFTGYSAIKIDDDKPLVSQLQKLVQQMLNAKRKSAAEFYETDTDYMQSLFRRH